MKRVVLALLLLAASGCNNPAGPMSPVEVYFSPNGGATEAVVRALDAARLTVFVQAYSFTNKPIAEALERAQNRGVVVHVILDKSNLSENYSEADFMAHHGISTLIDAKHQIAHNKIIIVDSQVVITGSFNFTRQAEEHNAENLLVIHDRGLAEKYLANWHDHEAHSQPYTGRGEVAQRPNNEREHRSKKRQGVLEEQLARMATIPEAFAIALAHHRAGRLDAAEEIYRRILAAEPDQPDALQLLGVIASQKGRHELAAEQIQCAIALKGNVAAYQNNLGEAYRGLRRIAEAAACFRRALELDPDLAEAHGNLGHALWELGRPEEAVARYHRALELNPRSAGVHSNLGNALKDLGRRGEALACYRRALELKPDFDEAHSNLGCALAESGDFAGAEAALRAAVGHNPRYALAYWKLAEILRGKVPDEDLAIQSRLLKEGKLTDYQRMFLHFGLAQILDARGEYAEAAEHAELANSLQAAQWRQAGRAYDPIEHERLVGETIEVCRPEFFELMGRFGLEDTGAESELAVFVVGLPRSGTTLVEQILASHSRVCGAGELPLDCGPLAELCRQADPQADRESLAPAEVLVRGMRLLDRETARRLAARYLERLRALGPAAARVVEKTPDNYLVLGLLAGLFPRAKFIHCRRDLRDVAVSCWMTNFREIRWANDQAHIAARFRQYRRIMQHWRNVLPAPLLEVDYEETVADLEAAARRLIAWCGLEWEPGCLEFHRGNRVVITASAVQVRQPIYRTAVGRWRHYEGALGSLFAQLE